MNQSRICAVAIVKSDGYWIGTAKENEPGYVLNTREPRFASYDEAKARAAEINTSIFRLSAEDAMKITLSSMRNGVAR